MKEIFDFLAKGGLVMIPIGLGSIVALAIFLERMWSLQESKIVPDGLLEKVLDLVRNEDTKTAREECLKSDTPLGRLLLVGFDTVSRTPSDIRQALEDAGRREVSRMERYIEAIGTTASLEPLLGLLGTVVGMMQVFQKVVVTAKSGGMDPSMLAEGIWQALITTAAGMSIGIPAFVAYRYLLARTTRHATDLEEGAVQLMETIAKQAGGLYKAEKQK